MTTFIRNSELKDQDSEKRSITSIIRNEAVTATNEGKVVVWGKSVLSQIESRQERLSAIKVVQIGPPVRKGKEGGLDTTLSAMISVLISQDNMIIAGFGDGSVKFYSSELKVLKWFEKFGASEIKSISFSTEDIQNDYSRDLYDSSEEMKVECLFDKFLVADSSGVVRHLKPEMHDQPLESREEPEILLEGFSEPVVCIAASPKDSVLTLGIIKGPIIFWDYENRNEIEEKRIPRDKMYSPWVMAYTPVLNDTLSLMVGWTDGTLRVYPQEKNTTIQMKEHKIKDQLSQNKKFHPEQIIITSDAFCMATRDNDYCVSLFKYETGANPANPDAIDWHFSGKRRSHKLPITSIAFVEAKTSTGKINYRLFSIGEDMLLFEYDVATSTSHEGMGVISVISIEQESFPSSLMWYPPSLAEGSNLLLWFNSNYKAKLRDISSNIKDGICKRTALGPVYAKEVTKLKLIDYGEYDKYLAYATESKVIGLMKLPIDGNPNRTMGLISHTGKIADISVSRDGKYLFTCGGKTVIQRRNEDIKSKDYIEEYYLDDFAVGMWEIDVTPIDQGMQMGGEGVEPFLSLIEGRTEGQTYKDIIDYFFYAQILSKDESTTKIRKLDGKVPLEQLKNLMNAMGYYPTEMEINDLMDEVSHDIDEETGESRKSIDLNYFIKLFVNHRPVYGINNEKIKDAFDEFLNEYKNSSPSDKKELKDSSDQIEKEQEQIPMEYLLNRLQTEGEKLSKEETEEILSYLTADTMKTSACNIDAQSLAKDVLGFEEIQDEEEEFTEDQLMFADQEEGSVPDIAEEEEFADSTK